MTELYQTSYKSRPPIIDGLLYAGAHILAGAPKIGKSFLVAQVAYHISTGKKLWADEVRKVRFGFKLTTLTARNAARLPESW